MATSALNVSAGARTRWSNFISGLVIVVVVLLFSQAVGYSAMPAMAALLIVAGIQSIKVGEVQIVWEVGLGSRALMLVTFVATLIVPVQWAVFIGVLLSAIVYFFTAADDVQIVALTPNKDKQLQITDLPDRLPSREVTFLLIRGNLFYAAVDKVDAMLPSARDVENPAVILGLLGQDEINSTFIHLLERYGEQVHASHGKLILAGVNKHIREQLDLTGITDELIGAGNIFMATDILGESALNAYQAGQAWLEGLKPDMDREG